MSDHTGIVFTLKNITRANNQLYNKNIRLVQPVTNTGKFIFFKELESVDWSFVECNDIGIENNFKIFIETIHHFINSSFPKIKPNSENPNQSRITWFNKDLIKMRDTLTFLDSFYKCTMRDECRIYRNMYRNRYRKELLIAKQKANCDYIKGASNKMKAMWDVINSKRPKTSKARLTSNLAANDLNDFFVNIPVALINKLPPASRDPLNFCLNVYVNNVDYFHFAEVSTCHVRDIINNMKSSRARDVYGMSADLIKSVKEILINPLTKLINRCIVQNAFPECLKKTVVIPVFKKGDASDPNNYRPISLVPIFSKIFEKVLALQLIEHFKRHNLLCKQQFGFRKEKSTLDAMLFLLDNIIEAYNNDEYLLASFLDLSKAFDCVNHSTLIQKLYVYNIHPSAISIITSFLKNRSQRVTTENSDSDFLPINSGVPQGSILGPFLFLVFVNDLPASLNNEGTVLFADDTTITNRGNDIKDVVQNNISTQRLAFDWLHSNGLAINQSKCVQIMFTLKHVPDASLLNMKIYEFTNFLGVTFDCQLLWKQHGAQLCNKLCKNTFIIRNLVNSVDEGTIRSSYMALFQSHLLYGLLLWGHASIRHEVFALQRRVVRIMCGLKFRDDCRDAFKKLKIMTLPSLFIYQCLLYIRKHIKEFNAHTDIHHHDTRNKDKIYLEAARLTRTQVAHKYHAVHFYNVLPTKYKNLDLNKFKFITKYLLCNGAFYSFEEFVSSFSM